jgi:hypothetical protein
VVPLSLNCRSTCIPRQGCSNSRERVAHFLGSEPRGVASWSARSRSVDCAAKEILSDFRIQSPADAGYPTGKSSHLRKGVLELAGQAFSRAQAPSTGPQPAHDVHASLPLLPPPRTRHLPCALADVYALRRPGVRQRSGMARSPTRWCPAPTHPIRQLLSEHRLARPCAGDHGQHAPTAVAGPPR